MFVVAGLILLWAGSAEWRHARASASWPTSFGALFLTAGILMGSFFWRNRS